MATTPKRLLSGVTSLMAVVAVLSPLEMRHEHCQKLFAEISSAEKVRPLPFAQINYRIYGAENSETIVLIHGLGGSLRTWKELAESLGKKYRVIIYDQRGHGKTPGIGENYGSRVMAGDLKSLLDGLHIDKVNLVGHSMGARTAVRFAEENPERVRSVTLEDMHIMGRKTALPDPRPRAEQTRQLAQLRFSSRAEAEDFLRERLDITEEETMRELIAQSESGFRLDVGTGAEPMYSAHGLQEDLGFALSKIQVPVMAIQADPNKGAVLWGKGLKDLQEANPSVVVVGFPGAGHGVHGDQPARYEEVLDSFVSGQKVPNSPLLYDLKTGK
ncbi:MAG: alpha/beta fold hydrolase [Bdellovibrionota bacterium]